jgi:phosphoribosylaminoimidazole carboxylase / phosphoribosylaminoimidazole-succinocarboxamide synthase
VIDADSWRVRGVDGSQLSKQGYRDGAELKEVSKKYVLAAMLTDRFALPRQRVVLWFGSPNDNQDPLKNALRELLVTSDGSLGLLVELVPIVCSAHKRPAETYRQAQKLVAEVSDSVFVVEVGMSDGAGPTLSANVSVPVITVRSGYKDFPPDVWSSLRAASDVPDMVMLGVGNAALAALQILAMRNPALYAALRLRQEERLDPM